MTTYSLVLPRLFWDDHYDRCVDHEGERIVLKQHPRTVEVLLDDAALEDLETDADYYANPGPPWDENYLRVIGRSAKATIRALEKQVAR